MTDQMSTDEMLTIMNMVIGITENDLAHRPGMAGFGGYINRLREQVYTETPASS